MSLFRVVTTISLVFLSAAGCQFATEPAETFILYVGPEQVPCQGLVPQSCLLIRTSPDADWSYLYDGIDGFTHEEGFSYRLLVHRREIENPPQDSSSITYRLIRVVEKTPGNG